MSKEAKRKHQDGSRKEQKKHRERKESNSHETANQVHHIRKATTSGSKQNSSQGVAFEINGGGSSRVVVNKPADGFDTEKAAASPSKQSSKAIEKQGSIDKTKPHSKAPKHSALK